jgi:hypothetical protein
MEVLKHGNTYKEVECKNCCALLSYCKADIEHFEQVDEIFGEWHSHYEESIKCPECNKKIVLYSFVD